MTQQCTNKKPLSKKGKEADLVFTLVIPQQLFWFSNGNFKAIDF